MNVISFGISHFTASVTERGNYYLSEVQKKEFIEFLSERFSLNGILIVCTCNRTDIYIETTEEKPRKFLHSFIEFMKGDPRDYKKFFFYKDTFSSANYFLAVSTGLLSLVKGDRQIYSQVREAFKFSLQLGYQGSLIERLFQSASHLHKKIRKYTNYFTVSESLSYLMVKEVVKHINLKKLSREALVIGAGEIAREVIPYLKKCDFDVSIVNRTDQKAASLAKTFASKSYGWDELDQKIADAPVIISCVGVKNLLSPTKTILRDKILVDLAVPNSIERLFENENVLIDMDHISRVIRDNSKKISTSEALVKKLIIEHHHNYMIWCKDRFLKPERVSVS